MNNEFILSQVKQNTTAGAPLNFADLMSRIEADGGKSTAPQMKSVSSPAKKVLRIAAGFVIAVGLSAAALTVITMGAPMASESECVMEEASDSYNDYSPVIEEEVFEEPVMEESDSTISHSETTAPEEEPVAGEVSDSDVSDSDVSDSDVSGSDAGEGE